MIKSKKFFHSVYLDEKLCRGCINCIKRCPTAAIRVRNGKARITSQFCIDCGECVRTCQHHAKKIHTDSLGKLSRFQYTVALPAPSLYAQFNNLKDINIVLTALISLGFDDVFEVSAAAEIVSQASNKYIEEHREKWPIVSTACPTVVRLIRVRFPNLIDHLLPINPPVEIAASMARQRAMEKTGLSAHQIGVFFISPCPSKVTYTRAPLGKEVSDIDGVIAAKDIYTQLLPHMKEAELHPMDLASSGSIGVGWGFSGGEANGINSDSYLAADGIENVIRVLEDLEDEKFESLRFIELDSCSGGCVGGVLNVENPYVAKAKLKNLGASLPKKEKEAIEIPPASVLEWTDNVVYEPVFKIGSNMIDSINKLKQIDELCKDFPGLDCGSCGAPSCKDLAEDIVRGKAEKNDCVHILKTHIHELSQTYTTMAREAIMEAEDPNACVQMLINYVDHLTDEIALLDSHHLRHSGKRKANDD